MCINWFYYISLNIPLTHRYGMCVTYRGPCIVSIFLSICYQQDTTLHSSFISGKPLFMFWVASPPIIRSTYDCIYSIWYLSNRYCYLPLLWESWSWFDFVHISHSNQLQLIHNSGR